MKKIAVFMGGLVYDSQRKILEGIYDQMDEREAAVYTFTCHVLATSGEKVVEGAHWMQRLPDLSLFDGVVLAPNTISSGTTVDWLFEEIKRTGVPAVSLDCRREGAASIQADNYNGMYELAEHLVTVHGKRKFYYLSGPQQNQDSSKRKKAFLDVMKRHGIPIGPAQIFEGSYAPESGKRAWDFWIKELGELPEVFVCANDAMAQGIMIELNIRGIRVPQQVLVTGVDNSREAAENEPRLTSIDRCYYKMGVEACKLLLMAKEGIPITDMQLHLPSKVVYSESCGCREDLPEDIRGYRREQVVSNFYIQEISAIIKSMISDFSGINSFEGMLEVVKRYVTWTDAQYFYLCMSDLDQVFPKEGILEHTPNLTQGYTEQMTVPLAYENGAFSSYGFYRRKEVLPFPVREKNKAVHYIMIPLHYQNESFGYCVFGNSNFPVDRDLCYTWVLTISGAIQNIRKNLLLQETVKKLNDMWIYDSLTGVYNRAGFFHLSREFLQKARKQKKGVYLLFLDLDGLKQVNDTYGHEAGDRYICQVAGILKRVTAANEMVMRYGGDEFAVMGEFREYNRADEIVKEIETELTIANRSGEYEFPLAVSMGYEGFEPENNLNLEGVLEQADQEMYKQKRSRKKEQHQEEL